MKLQKLSDSRSQNKNTEGDRARLRAAKGWGCFGWYASLHLIFILGVNPTAVCVSVYTRAGCRGLSSADTGTEATGRKEALVPRAQTQDPLASKRHQITRMFLFLHYVEKS